MRLPFTQGGEGGGQGCREEGTAPEPNRTILLNLSSSSSPSFVLPGSGAHTRLCQREHNGQGLRGALSPDRGPRKPPGVWGAGCPRRATGEPRGHRARAGDRSPLPCVGTGRGSRGGAEGRGEHFLTRIVHASPAPPRPDAAAPSPSVRKEARLTGPDLPFWRRPRLQPFPRAAAALAALGPAPPAPRRAPVPGCARRRCPAAGRRRQGSLAAAARRARHSPGPRLHFPARPRCRWRACFAAAFTVFGIGHLASVHVPRVGEGGLSGAK